MKVETGLSTSAGAATGARAGAPGIMDGHFGVMLQQWIELAATAAEGEAGRPATTSTSISAAGALSPGFVSTVQRFGGRLDGSK